MSSKKVGKKPKKSNVGKKISKPTLLFWSKLNNIITTGDEKLYCLEDEMI